MYLENALGDRAIKLPDLKRVLVGQRVSLMEQHARKCARQLAGVVRGHVESGFHNTGVNARNAFSLENIPVYQGMLRQYGCEPSLVAYALSCAEQLLQRRGVVR
jgi:hypothetical protein